MIFSMFGLTKLNHFGDNFIHAEMVQAFLTSIEYRQGFGCETAARVLTR
jgi:hypothetical protein